MDSKIDDSNLFQDFLEEIETQISNEETTVEESEIEPDLIYDEKKEDSDLESNTLKVESKVTKKRIVKKPIKNKIIENIKPKRRTIIFGKNKTIQENLEILKQNLNIIYNVDVKNNIIINKNDFKEKLKFPTFMSLSKASKLNNLENFSLIIVDDNNIEYSFNKILVSEHIQKDKNLILLNMSPFGTFQKLFLDLIINKISFTTLSSLIALSLTAKDIIICNRFDVMNYILLLLFNKLNLLEKVKFINKENINLDTINLNNSDKLKEELLTLKIDNLTLVSFLKANKLPENIKENVIFSISKLINFKTQFKYEAFDGMTKLMLKVIKEKDLNGMSFNSLSQCLTKEYPWIPEKELLKHYLYIVNNFNQNGQIPLFSFDTQKLIRTSIVKINKKILNTILAFSIIVKKKYGDFWISFIPVQLFYAKDFYALDLKKIYNILVTNNIQKIISDNDNKLYLHVNKDGIVSGPRNTHRLELTGMSKNVLNHFDPTISKEEFILNLINGNISHTIKDNSIVIDNVDKAAKFLKFSVDKDNLLFDFTNIIIYNISKSDKKTVTSYDVLLKYYNEFISFNFKLFKTYFYYYIYQKISSKNIKEKINDLIQKEKESSKAVLNQYNYPSSFDLEENLVFETDFFNEFDISNIDTECIADQCSSYLKKSIIRLYKEYIVDL